MFLDLVESMTTGYQDICQHPDHQRFFQAEPVSEQATQAWTRTLQAFGARRGHHLRYMAIVQHDHKLKEWQTKV